MAKRRSSGTGQQVSVAQAVRTYIDARPVVRDALALGIVNLSALTRRIRDETGLGSEEAVLVACRRYTPKTAQADYQARYVADFGYQRLFGERRKVARA